ncbi:MAG: substrate-binding domain-containing protein [Bacteroidota bacterium]
MKNIIKYGEGFFLFSGIIFLLFFAACGGSPSPKDVDTPTSGRIRICVDDSYKLLIDGESYTFESLYKYAHPDIVYKNEADVINDLMNDSASLIIVNRKLSDKQVKILEGQQYIARTTKIALDALALIVNNDNPDTTMYYQTVREIFQGKIKNWKQVNPKSKLKDLSVVFDNFKSGNPRYFKEKFALDSFPSNCFAAQNNEEVISYVEKNRNAVGIISVNWISDREDTVSHNFLKRFKVVAVAMEGETGEGTHFRKPYPGYIFEGSYPFTRDVYCINRQSYTGLAHGFSSFLAGEKGQFIVLHSGLVPAAMPVRTVEIKH